MSAKNKNLSFYPDIKGLATANLKVALVVSDYNTSITGALRKGALQALAHYGVKANNVLEYTAPGAFELPLAAQWIYEQKKPDAVIVLGCVIKGDTDHDKYINHAVAQGLTSLGIQYKIPFVFGVITPNNMKQAKERAGGKHGNKGVECVVAALQMLALKNVITAKRK